MNCNTTNDRIGYIYLIEHQQAIKVGFSDNPIKRLASLQTANYLTLTLVATFVASFDQEQLFHTEYLHLSYGNEWYPLSLKTEALFFLENFNKLSYCRPRFPKRYITEASKLKASQTRAARKLENDLEAERCRVTNEMKINAIRASFKDIDNWYDSGLIFHAESSEAQALIAFGKKERVKNYLGFDVPIATKGSRKGKPEPIKYLRKIVELFGYTLSPCQKQRTEKGQRNIYRIIKPD